MLWLIERLRATHTVSVPDGKNEQGLHTPQRQLSYFVLCARGGVMRNIGDSLGEIRYSESIPNFLERQGDGTSVRNSIRQFLPAFAVACADFIVVGLVLFVAKSSIEMSAVTLRDGSHILPSNGSQVATVVVLLLLFAYRGLYRQQEWETGEFGGVIAACALMAIIQMSLFWDSGSALAGLIVWPVVALAVLVIRPCIRSVPLVRKAMVTDVMLIGTGVTAKTLDFQQRGSRSGRLNVVRQATPDLLKRLDGRMILRMLERHGASSVSRSPAIPLIAPGPGEWEASQDLIASLNAAGRPYLLALGGEASGELSIRNVVGSDLVLGQVRHRGQNGLNRAVKRAMDIAIATIILALIAPVYVTIASVLHLCGGPIFFSQPRIGRNGARFSCYKFCSMRPDAQDRLLHLLASDPSAAREWATHQKLENDPRITWFGKFLRTTSLDELPQLFNVLKGDMSFVGPRPIIAPEIDGYPSDYGYYYSDEFKYYMACTPGITGLWQVSGRAKTAHEERVRLDRWYAQNWSWKLDLLILLKTFRAVFGGSGS